MILRTRDIGVQHYLHNSMYRVIEYYTVLFTTLGGTFYSTFDNMEIA